MHNLEGKAVYICIQEQNDNAKERENMIEIGYVAFSITFMREEEKAKHKYEYRQDCIRRNFETHAKNSSNISIGKVWMALN